MRSIFISYRRSDTPGETGRLSDDLVKQFGEGAVFMDVSAITAGSDFRKAIDESIANCGVLLVIVGPEWLAATDDQGTHRLDDPMDFVRLEISAALKRDIPVIPVLVRGAKMPRADQLPPDVADLAYRNCVELTHVRWKSDLQLLLKALRPLVEDPAHAAPTSADATTVGLPLAQPSHAVGGPASIDPATVQRIARELAVHIGPIAEIVVKRAAARCSSFDELCRQVSSEIESTEARRSFLAAVLR
jgi:hypothetical protein